MKNKLYLFEVETFKERCERELKEVIWDCIDINLNLYIEECEIEYYEGYIPLLCEIIAMGTYLPHKWFRGEWIFTSQKLPKPIHKLTFEHNGKDYSIMDLVHIRLEEGGLKFPFYKICEGFKKLNVQKTRANKYFKLDAIM